MDTKPRHPVFTEWLLSAYREYGPEARFPYTDGAGADGISRAFKSETVGNAIAQRLEEQHKRLLSLLVVLKDIREEICTSRVVEHSDPAIAWILRKIDDVIERFSCNIAGGGGV